MATINKTFIGTSEDASLCKGLPLFNALSTSGAGYGNSGANYELFNTNISLLVFRISANASVGFYFGICGPGYGFRVDADGAYDGKDLTLNIKNDALQAGMFFGLNATAGFYFNVDRIDVQWVWDGWNSGIRIGWANLINLRFNLTFDLINLFLDLVLYLLRESGNPNSKMQSVQNWTPTLLGSYGIFDAAGGQFASSGQMSARPTFVLPINIVNLIPGLKTINDALLALHGWLSVGPSIGFAIPTTVRIAGARLSGGGQSADYNVTSVSGGVVKATTNGSPPANADSLGLVMRHTAGFQLVCGFGASACVMKLFQVGVSTDLSILELLGLTITGDAHDNMVSNNVGRAAGAVHAGADGIAESKLPRFKWAPPTVNA